MQNERSARIFVHPRCAEGTASGALSAYLQGCGYDLQKIALFWDAKLRRHELVRRMGESDITEIFKRMDGSQFIHRMGEIDESPPEAA